MPKPPPAQSRVQKSKSADKATPATATVTLPDGYVPSETEAFMNPLQREYFRQKLLEWKQQLEAEIADTLSQMAQRRMQRPDTTDRARLESEASLELRTRDRENKLLGKIDAALKRIDDGSYGYCEDTGEAIGLARLMARPIASLSLDAQERHERMEQTHRDD